MWMMYHGISLYLAARNWRKTTATVLSLSLTDFSKYDREYGESHSYECYVEYSYIVNHTVYSGNQASIFWKAGDHTLCYRLAQKRGHDEIPVIYNPDHPKTSLLDRTFHEFELTKIAVVSTVGYLAGIYLLLFEPQFSLALALMAAGCLWYGSCIIWGYFQTNSKFIFYALFSFVIGIVYLVASAVLIAISCQHGISDYLEDSTHDDIENLRNGNDQGSIGLNEEYISSPKENERSPLLQS